MSLTLLALGLPLLLADAPAWPPRDLLLRSLVAGVEPTLKRQDPATGRFGSLPWICTDQNVLFPLAVAWGTQDPANPWYHDARLLTAIAKGGDALVDAQDAQGRWEFRKKDNSTWGPIHMPWTYSRWIRAWLLVRDALPAEDRARWEQGLRLGFTGIRKYMDGGIQNIPCHHAMGLYLAGQAFDNADWRDAAAKYQARVVAEQDPAGFWTEHHGPVVGYNHVYVDALGVYYAASKDAKVLEALRRSAKFHAAVLWPDGSPVPSVDERQIYHNGRDLGTVGFSWTDEGRGYLVQQILPYLAPDKTVDFDWAAAMLTYGGTGPATMPAATADRARAVIGPNKAVVERRKPWQWAFSAYACKPIESRWIQDRQNLVDVYHDDLGLVVGGGNTKLQPYWSTFTVGDPDTLSHRTGDESPKFVPDLPLRWFPEQASLDLPDGPPVLHATVGGVACTVRAEPQADGSLALSYRAEAQAGQRVEAHVPLLRRSARLRTGTGKTVRLTESPVVLSSAELGERFSYGGLTISVPPGASLRWPAWQHDPYTKDGHSTLAHAKLVLTVPLTTAAPEQRVVLARETPAPFDGLTFRTKDLPVASPTGTATKWLAEFDSVFLGGRKDGDAMVFTLPPVPAGRYELLLDFVLAPSYATVEVALNGAPRGRFDAYAPELDGEGERVSFGEVTLAAGAPTLTVTVAGANAKAERRYVSVQRVMLRKR